MEFFGPNQLKAYSALIELALGRVGADPRGLGTSGREDIGPGVRSRRLADVARRRGAASHSLYFLLQGDDADVVTVVLRVLHDRMESCTVSLWPFSTRHPTFLPARATNRSTRRERPGSPLVPQGHARSREKVSPDARDDFFPAGHGADDGSGRSSAPRQPAASAMPGASAFPWCNSRRCAVRLRGARRGGLCLCAAQALWPSTGGPATPWRGSAPCAPVATRRCRRRCRGRLSAAATARRREGGPWPTGTSAFGSSGARTR